VRKIRPARQPIQLEHSDLHPPLQCAGICRTGMITGSLKKEFKEFISHFAFITTLEI
jgi:hypothetical protein